MKPIVKIPSDLVKYFEDINVLMLGSSGK